MTDAIETPAAPSAPVVPALNIPAEALPKPPAASPAEGAVTEGQPEAETTGPEDQEQDKSKPRQKASERIGELYGRLKAAERQRDFALSELERARQPLVSQQQYDGLSFDDQQRVQVREAVREQRAEELAAEARRHEIEANAYRAQQFNERVAAVSETIPDLDEKLNDPTLPVSEVAWRFISQSERGPQVGYWLATNRTEAERIHRLHPVEQAYELGRIEARVAAPSNARKVSRAPAPVPTVGGSGGSGQKDPGAMSTAEYIAWRKAGNNR